LCAATTRSATTLPVQWRVPCHIQHGHNISQPWRPVAPEATGGAGMVR